MLVRVSPMLFPCAPQARECAFLFGFHLPVPSTVLGSVWALSKRLLVNEEQLINSAKLCPKVTGFEEIKMVLKLHSLVPGTRMLLFCALLSSVAR